MSSAPAEDPPGCNCARAACCAALLASGSLMAANPLPERKDGLFGSGRTFNFLNVYNDADDTALDFLEERNTPVSLTYMGGDFNCHSSAWDPVVSHHRASAISLLETAAIMGLDLTSFENPGATFISHNPDLRPSVIDLIFVSVADSIAIRSIRLPDLRSTSDHVPISVSLDLDLNAPEIERFSIQRGSEEDYACTGAIIAKVAAIDRHPISPGDVDAFAQALADAFDGAWKQHRRRARIVPESKPWWSKTCQEAFNSYSSSRTKEDWSSFRRAVRAAKRDFFAERIQEVAITNMRPWDLMEWVKQRKNPPCEAIQHNGQPCHDLPQLWDALHSTYNSATGRVVDLSILDPLPRRPVREWRCEAALHRRCWRLLDPPCACRVGS